MAAAMMSRGFGYDIDHRTELKPSKFETKDWIMAGIFAAFLVGGFLLGFLGHTQYTFTMHILGFRQSLPIGLEQSLEELMQRYDDTGEQEPMSRYPVSI